MATLADDLAIDLETLSTRYDGAVLAIGAVAFNRDTGKVLNEFYTEIDINQSVRCGHVDGSTVAWWLRQGEVAKAMFTDDSEALKKKIPLGTALHGFTNFVRSNCNFMVRAWGNGATVDITLLEHAFVHGGVGLTPPWNYKRIRDLRTLVDDAEVVGGVRVDLGIGTVGTKHNALDDARWAAKVITAAHKVLTSHSSVKPTKPTAKKSEVKDDDY